jgi:hypothetical protein
LNLKYLKLKYDGLFSSSAFDFNLRVYTKEDAEIARAEADAATAAAAASNVRATELTAALDATATQAGREGLGVSGAVVGPPRCCSPLHGMPVEPRYRSPRHQHAIRIHIN